MNSELLSSLAGSGASRQTSRVRHSKKQRATQNTEARMSKPLNILVVEDSQDDTLLLLHELRRGDYAPTYERVDTAPALTAALEKQKWDIVVADFSMPQFNALAALDIIRKKGYEMPFIIVSGTIGEELAVTAMKNGAQDYIMKGNLKRLVPAIQRELREAVHRSEKKQAEDKLRETQEQFRVAHEIQQRLFPKSSPRLEAFDIAGISHPAEATGGDYYDYLPMADGSLGIVVADVTGHGIGPALLMAETRAYLRTSATNATDVGQILTQTNTILAEDVDLERFVTVMFAKLDPVAHTLVYASAGHPTGYLIAQSGEIKTLLKQTGVPFGVPPRVPYSASPVIPLAAGDIILLLTDGLEEAACPDNSLFGTERILRVVREHASDSAQTILSALEHAVRNFCESEPTLDDLTAVVAKVKS
jgi:serine phosphatase RsbU (regulator of sigma subunit)